MNKKLFSKKNIETHMLYHILGIRFKIKNKLYWEKIEKENLEAIQIQNSYDLKDLQQTKKLILFLTPSLLKINGGVMSIFSLCETSRKLNPDKLCLISTDFNKYTYAQNDMFLNEEKIYRFSQIVDNCKNLDELILHIPEYLSKRLYNTLSRKERKFLKSIKNLQINILNQNIDVMPKPKRIKNLYKLTNNITQTIAHDRYATQEVCDKWGIPTHLFSALWDMSKYQKRDFEEKEKIIVLSPDEHEYREKIVETLKQNLPDWKLITVKNMTYSEYMDLISRAFFTITFGEGMDGYFLQPAVVKSIGVAVYNDNFFPDRSWLNLDNVFENYDDLLKNIIKFIEFYSQNSEKYVELSTLNKKFQDGIYSMEKYKDNIKRFYERKYDYLPTKLFVNETKYSAT